jgi:RNA 3'-terminal phosphate cyclase (ATP)
MRKPSFSLSSERRLTTLILADRYNLAEYDMEQLEIDGSFGEGGGQILRTTVTFAAITGRPITLHSIRGGREKPGLQPQHLAAVRAAQTLCDAEVKGDAVNSMFLSFRPRKPVEAGHYRFDIGTAGSTSLVLQTVFPALAMCDGTSQVTVTGGTHNPKAPTVDYLHEVFEQTISHFGWLLDIECPTPGFYPAGGGRLEAKVYPAKPRPFDLDTFATEHGVTAIAHSSIPREDLFARAKDHLAVRHRNSSMPLRFERILSEGPSPGVGLTLVAANGFYRAGFSALGARQKSMEKVCDEAYDEYRVWASGAPGLDEHLADQLAPLAALTQGHSVWRTQTVSDHLRTVLKVIEWFGMATTDLDEETGVVRVSR